MKKVLLLLLCFVALESFATIKNYTIKVGERKWFGNVLINGYEGYITGDAITVEFTTNYTGDIWVTGVKAGYSTFINLGEPGNTYLFHVVDVTDIDIPDQINLSVGGQYNYSPIITDSEAETTLTWASTNTSVATVSNSGAVTAVSPGTTTITCTAANGVKAQSLISVSPLLISSITLDKQSHEMNVGDEVQLSATVAPSNATERTVKWMSTNENIAQVDDQGNVTAMAQGYCSIFCIADDNSRKYDKCLVHVLGTQVSRADVNADGKVSVTDAFTVIDVILNQ